MNLARNLITLALAIALALVLALGSPFTDGGGDDARGSPRANLVFFTGDTAAGATRSVTIHIYDANTRQVAASACLRPVDVSGLSVDSNATPADVFYVGATANDVPCTDPKLSRREAQGRPPPDQRYVDECSSLARSQELSAVTFYRYPEQFQDSKPPKCPTP